MTLIAEDLLLLLLDDEKGSLAASDKADTVLGGAVLAELALSGAVTIAERASRFRSPKVHATGAMPGDRILVDAVGMISAKDRTAEDLVGKLGKGLKNTLADRLAERGILERRRDKVLGLVPRTRWPALDTSHEEEVRRALTACLVQGAEPDERTGALVALLSAIDQAHKLVDHEAMSSKEVKARAKEIAEGAWAAKAVKNAIEAATTAVTAAVFTAGAGGAAASS